ncbi:MAG TPA: Fur family transcriptional regulator [Halanaerobiales bacterium]|nr:Fur family transcriptional regulator [Halanaerobiales bacterium]
MFPIKTIKDLLEKKGIEASFQRLKIYQYLIREKNHPTVNMIFKALSREIPTLSKTTVYNNLKLFEEKEMVVALNLSDHEVRFDADTTVHGHFKCRRCEKIYDFKINSIDTDLKGYKIEEKEVYYTGICKDCLSEEKGTNLPN